jgi:hypothetical protein
MYITVLVAVTTSFFLFLPFLRPTLIMMDSFEYASLISLDDLSYPLSFLLAWAFTLANPHSWVTPSPLDSPDPIGVPDSILDPPFEHEIVSLLFLRRPPRSVVNKLPLTISAPILPVAGSTFQTSRPLTSSQCPSSLMSHPTTT